MTQRIAGPGLGLPLPQNLYPTQLNNAPPDVSTNRIALAPGDTLPIPAGDWFVNLGQYCVFQFLDPVTNIWNMGPNAAWQGGHQFVVSDGFNVRPVAGYNPDRDDYRSTSGNARLGFQINRDHRIEATLLAAT